MNGAPQHFVLRLHHIELALEGGGVGRLDGNVPGLHGGSDANAALGGGVLKGIGGRQQGRHGKQEIESDDHNLKSLAVRASCA